MRTRVGYAGGDKSNPSYRSLGSHAEAVQVVFDPSKVSYEELLDIFWESHDPTRRSWSTQYRSMILTSGEAQRRKAESSRDLLADRLGKKIATAITPLDVFYPAEDYHQKYYLRSSAALMAEIEPLVPTAEQLRDSTLAARLNGYLGGYGSPGEFEELARELGVEPSRTGRICGMIQKPGR